MRSLAIPEEIGKRLMPVAGDTRSGSQSVADNSVSLSISVTFSPGRVFKILLIGIMKVQGTPIMQKTENMDHSCGCLMVCFDDDGDRAIFFKDYGYAIFGGNAFVSSTRVREQFGMCEGAWRTLRADVGWAELSRHEAWDKYSGRAGQYHRAPHMHSDLHGERKDSRRVDSTAASMAIE
jgi:hypothetical protein